MPANPPARATDPASTSVRGVGRRGTPARPSGRPTKYGKPGEKPMKATSSVASQSCSTTAVTSVPTKAATSSRSGPSKTVGTSTGRGTGGRCPPPVVSGPRGRAERTRATSRCQRRCRCRSSVLRPRRRCSRCGPRSSTTVRGGRPRWTCRQWPRLCPEVQRRRQWRVRWQRPDDERRPCPPW